MGLGVAKTVATAVAVVAAVMGRGHARGAERGRVRGRGGEDTSAATPSPAEAPAPTSTGTGNTTAFSVTKEYKVQGKNRSVNLLICYTWPQMYEPWRPNKCRQVIDRK